ncbi:MAG: nanoRNase/pAp phosphatase (c-di-AMP/oligoRNAs hydrolase) [Planctomycetota bacterium]|jgi:nanoRNase/pAp phosphatase (c-di-AMP/oligoRNAs hydrolase)
MPLESHRLSSADIDGGASEDSDAAAPEDRLTFPGLLPVHHLQRVLQRASEAAPEKARGRFLVLTHRGPDPDALGACEGLRSLLRDGFGFEPVVATLGRIHRAENLALVRALDLSLADYEGIDPTDFAGATLVDTQPQFGHTVLPENCPVLAVFDHHVPPVGDAIEVPHHDVRLNLGATASMIYEYLRDARVDYDEKTATALFCGVRYDTADLSRNSSPLDEEAYYECFRRGDRNMIADIAHPPLPQGYYRDLHRALKLARRHGALVIAFLGKVDNPESVAEMADFFLRMKGCSWVVAGGAYEEGYVLSLRTDYAFGKAYPLMSRVLGEEGSFGGHGHIAGGRIQLEDDLESTVQAVERRLRQNALNVIGVDDEDGIPPEGRLLTE